MPARMTLALRQATRAVHALERRGLVEARRRPDGSIGYWPTGPKRDCATAGNHPGPV